MIISLIPWRTFRSLCAICVLGAGYWESWAEEPTVQDWVQQYAADIKTLDERYRVPLDADAQRLRESVTQDWLQRLTSESFDQLDRVSQVDYLLLRSELEYQLARMRLEESRDRQAREFLPYCERLVQFCKHREDVKPFDAGQMASDLDRIAQDIERLVVQIELAAPIDPGELFAARQMQALRATELLEEIRRSVEESHRFYNGYDPQYSWWAQAPMERLLRALKLHQTSLRENIVGVPESDINTIIGLPIGEEGLELELRHEWIAHDPTELVELAQREMRWCEEQLDMAADELGYEGDWRSALEHVKSKHVAPGQQPAMIRDLAWEAIRFLEAHDLVTVPPLAANGWRMTMMSPENQRLNPYFLGGPRIIVSFPTNDMTHEEKLMSMRSNNEHFSRATVHHELIPGHHLQHYMLPRYRPYRSLFQTPFWMEGWALYWEMLLWDLGFAQSAEDRVGMLFWRKHRCARIIFSLNYHLAKLSPEECIDYLVHTVGHERSAATAEVRRSIMGGYSPLYQAAYMLGGLQLREMHGEIVQAGRMTNRQFHDAILREHSIPIEILRAHMIGQELTSNTQPSWRFADE